MIASVPGFAQSQRSGGGEAQKFMQQYQQIAAEKTALQTQVEQMKKDLDAAKAELTSIRKERDVLKANAGATAALTQAQVARETAEKNLESTKQRLNDLVGRFRDMATSLKEAEQDRVNLRKDLQDRTATLDRCAEHNLQLFEINQEVLDRYEHVGFFTKAGAAEPFTALTRTRIENLVDEYRARALENRERKRSP